MADSSTNQAGSYPNPNANTNTKTKYLCLNGKLVRGTRIAMEVAMAMVCIFWISWWFVSPHPKGGNHQLEELFKHKKNQPAFFRTDDEEGFMFIFQTFPMLVATLLAFGIIGLRSLENHTLGRATNKTHYPKHFFGQLMRYPVWIGSPFDGVLTLGESLFILSVLFVIVYYLGRMCYWEFGNDAHDTSSKLSKNAIPESLVNFRRLSFWFGKVALLPFSLLWIPVSRGSPFLRVIRVPFDRAVKYHTWLGTLTILLVGLHGVGYIIYYILTNQAYKMFLWDTSRGKRSLLAGFLAWISGFIIWITSLPYVRRKFYEFFFILHHLYIFFLVFWIYHVVWTYHFFVVPVILFLIDRFIRMIQSRRQVDILSATILDSGVVKLNLVKKSQKFPNEHLTYNTLSTWCIQIPSLSHLQWHFFSTTSSQLDETQTLSILIKPLGGWTRDLSTQLKDAHTQKVRCNSHEISTNTQRCPFLLKARVEGPYGDESNFYLGYKTLILVGGGIGITPLLAILRDILHRYKQSLGANYLPKSIEVYHCVRKLENLDLLYDVNPKDILPNYTNLGLSIKVHVYVTSQNKCDYGRLADVDERSNDMFDLSVFEISKASSTIHNVQKPLSSISNISSNGNMAWVALITLTSMIGYILLWGLENISILRLSNHKLTNYNQAHLIIMNMLLGTMVFGGSAILLWDRYNKVPPKSTKPLPSMDSQDDSHLKDNEIGSDNEVISPWSGNLHLGKRPIWKDVFNKLAQEYDDECVGVLVSGTKTMQQDIARECRRNSNIFGEGSSLKFDHHQVSFDL